MEAAIESKAHVLEIMYVFLFDFNGVDLLPFNKYVFLDDLNLELFRTFLISGQGSKYLLGLIFVFNFLSFSQCYLNPANFLVH